MKEDKEDVVEGWVSLHPGMLWRGGCSLHPLLLLFNKVDSLLLLWLLFTGDTRLFFQFYNLLLGNTGTRAEKKTLRSSKAEPGRGPRGRRGACGSGTNEGSKIPRGNHGLRCGRWPRLGGIIKKNEKKREPTHTARNQEKKEEISWKCSVERRLRRKILKELPTLNS
jgi:hypothetical protein